MTDRPLADVLKDELDPPDAAITMTETIASLRKLAAFLDGHAESLTKAGVHASAHRAGLSAATTRDVIAKLQLIQRHDVARAAVAARQPRAVIAQEKT